MSSREIKVLVLKLSYNKSIECYLIFCTVIKFLFFEKICDGSSWVKEYYIFRPLELIPMKKINGHIKVK